MKNYRRFIAIALSILFMVATMIHPATKTNANNMAGVSIQRPYWTPWFSVDGTGNLKVSVFMNKGNKSWSQKKNCWVWEYPYKFKNVGSRTISELHYKVSNHLEDDGWEQVHATGSIEPDDETVEITTWEIMQPRFEVSKIVYE